MKKKVFIILALLLTCIFLGGIYFWNRQNRNIDEEFKRICLGIQKHLNNPNLSVNSEEWDEFVGWVQAAETHYYSKRMKDKTLQNYKGHTPLKEKCDEVGVELKKEP